MIMKEAPNYLESTLLPFFSAQFLLLGEVYFQKRRSFLAELEVYVERIEETS